MEKKTITFECNNCGAKDVQTYPVDAVPDSRPCWDCSGTMYDKYAERPVIERISEDEMARLLDCSPKIEPQLGRKNDTDKLRYDLISPLWEEGLAEIMTGAPGIGGAGEYGARNWEQGLLVSRVYAALRRHISAWIKGEDNDPISGKSHLFHANACLMFLWAMPQIHPELDDRAAIRIIPSDL